MILALIAVPALTALLAPYVSKRGALWSRALIVVPLGLLVACWGWRDELGVVRLSWATAIGIEWGFVGSPARVLFATLVTGVGAVVVGYACAYFYDAKKRGRLLSFLFGFMAAMLGLVFADNLFVLLLCWEATSVLSFFLIGFYTEKDEARRAAIDAFLLTGAGGIALVLATVLLGQIGGSYQLSELALVADVIREDRRYPLLVASVLLAAATKSAQMPFHFWLPGAMAAPAPVSAYLHSATMVKAGVFLILIMTPVVGGTELWQHSVQVLGMISMVVGAFLALTKTDVKAVLAMSTISALGTLIVLLGLETAAATAAAMVYLVAHAMYKASLFMVAGALEKATGTRDIREMGGLARSLPILAVAGTLAALSMAGLPPFVGFIGKELLYEAGLETGWAVTSVIFVGSVFMMAIGCRVSLLPFFGAPRTDAAKAKTLSLGMSAAPLVLAVAGLVFGLLPSVLLEGWLRAALIDLGAAEIPKIKLWHGINTAFLLSLATFACGAVAYLATRPGVIRFRVAEGLNFQLAFREFVGRTVRHAAATTRTIHDGGLGDYAAYLVLTALFLILGAWYASAFTFRIVGEAAWQVMPTLAMAFAAVCAVGVWITKNRIAMILLLGGCGCGLATIFAALGAPDVAVTQLIVETLALALMGLLMIRLPKIGTRKPVPAAMVISIVLGVLFAFLTLKAISVTPASRVGAQFGDLSLAAAYGRNVVNVILVDFRAFDTLGEVAVLVLAALGIEAMVQRRRTGFWQLRVLGLGARKLSILIGVVAIIVTLRGHNEPGGGFIGGLMGTIALWLASRAKKPLLPLRLERSADNLMIGGLLACILSGVPALLAGKAYMTAVWLTKVWLPIVGDVGIGTPLLFDLGVFCIVLGVGVILIRDALTLGQSDDHSSAEVR